MPDKSRPEVRAFFDEATNTASYLVVDPSTREAAVVDPILDYDRATGNAATGSADRILSAAREEGAAIAWVLETHAHANHLSAAPYIKQKTGAYVGIGEHVRGVQKIFRPVFNIDAISIDGSAFDRLFTNGEHFSLGQLDVEVMHTPGHTPACVSYVVGDAVFVGDNVFMPGYGAPRAGCPGADARALLLSIRKLLALPAETRVFVGHGYKPNSRDTHAWETTIGAQRENRHIVDVDEETFVATRMVRDTEFALPPPLLPSIRTHIRADQLPPAESNGVSYVKIPVRLAS